MTVVAGSAPAATAPPDHLLYGRARLVAFGTVALGMLLSAMDSTIVSTALPTIVGDLGGGNHVSWVVTAYLLTQTVSAAVVGKLGDQFGRKRVFQTSVVVFIIGSALCGLSPGMGWLIGSRAIQGIGGGGLTVTATALIADVIPLRDRGRYQGSLGAVFGVTTVLGPLIGGYFTDNLSWRWAFYVNVPLALLVIVLAARTIPRGAGRSDVRIDWWGMAAVGLGASALILATNWGGTTYAWSSPVIIGLFVVGAALLGLFILIELRTDVPILPIDMFKERAFAVCCALSFVVGFTMLGAMTFLPTFLQYVEGVSATASGVRMLPLVAGMLATSISVGLYVSHTGRYKAFPVAGGLVMALGLYLLSRMDASTEVWRSAVYMVVLGLGIGLSMQVLTIIVQNSVPYRRLGVATSAVTFMRTIGSAFGAAIFGTLYANFLDHRLPSALAAAPGVTPDDLATPESLHALGADVIAPVVDAYAWALDRVFLWASPVALVAFVIALLLPNGRLSDDLQPAAADLGEGFGAPDARPAEERIAQRVANLLYRQGRDGLLEMLDQADLGIDEGRVWALAQVHGHCQAGRAASVPAIARSRRVPTILLAPAFEELRERGYVDGPADDLRPTATGEQVIDRLTDTFRAWILAHLRGEATEAESSRARLLTGEEVAAVDAVIGQIAARLVREEAEEPPPLVSVGAHAGRAGPSRPR
ncbi:MDR family MFS transporter [Nocardioides sp. CER19]|uniref:MDR family MFS transporter n=1 Tax=Nocardioides sp. CER19 TaxID=3038538 RepID=UPI00244C3B42|nr:MDR family MFS transporter [Nocardioides sp. CER19]MDH2416282.1 MDR family MFS transporter [Nocardioides sp. CER19]